MEDTVIIEPGPVWPRPDSEAARNARVELMKARAALARIEDVANLESWKLAYPGLPTWELRAWCELWEWLKA